MITQPNNQSSRNNPVGRFMVAAGALIQHAVTKKILLIRRAAELDWQGGEWEITYGRIDQFETAQTGLLREVREETVITDIEIHDVLSVWHIFRGPESAENEVIGITFHCTTHQDTPVLSNEHSNFKWVTAEEALELVSVEGIRRDIKKFAELHQN